MISDADEASGSKNWPSGESRPLEWTATSGSLSSAGPGLEVEQGDIFERIRRQPNESLGAVTLFHVLEHLPFMAMVDLLGQACRALVPGGLLIAEVPNAKNVRVASGTFWIDPTHERPWYPDLLEFLARQAGFAEVSGEYANPLAPEPELEDLQTSVRGVISSLHEAINGPADYCLIARR